MYAETRPLSFRCNPVNDLPDVHERVRLRVDGDAEQLELEAEHPGLTFADVSGMDHISVESGQCLSARRDFGFYMDR